MTSIFLADDHPLLMKGLCELIASVPALQVVGTASNGTQALEAIRSLVPDVAILDLIMPGSTGLQIMEAIASDHLPVRVIFLTAMMRYDQLLEALALGAWGVLLKEAAPERLIDCIMAVVAGRRQIAPELLHRVPGAAASSRGPLDRDEMLTPREREVIALVCQGARNAEIAAALEMATGTVQVHLHNIYAKLGLNGRSALIARAMAPIAGAASTTHGAKRGISGYPE